MPPAPSAIVGHAVSQPAKAVAAAINTPPQPSRRPLAMTPGSDFLIRLHVEDEQEVKGTIIRDSDVFSAFEMPSASTKHVASTTQNIASTWLRVTTKESSQRTKVSVAPALTRNLGFQTMVALPSRVTESSGPSITYARSMSTPSSATVGGWTSRAPVQQSATTSTPAPASGRASNVPFWQPLFYAVVALLALGVWFAITTARINWSSTPPRKDKSGLLKRFLHWGKKMGGANQKTNPNKNTELHEIAPHNPRPDKRPSTSLQIRECIRINTRKANLHSPSYPPSPSTTSSFSPPQTPRLSSHSEFAPQALTTSSTYTTPTTTPLHPTFPPPSIFAQTTTLRHRTHGPPSPLILLPPSSSGNKSTGVDLEDQTPISSPRRCRSGVAAGSADGDGDGEVVGTEREREVKVKVRIGGARWVAHVVDGLGDWFVGFTKGEGEGGPVLPVN
ncbi:hypothetical protein FKW77_009656 [Venturia effusa]|uniref:Uncharacterized protein n=1 Tax=Venturia effusa TaxID=50376 RepID=A0A517L073_9PEZI|nr:hypothetical protein FKW77_009656 [Venturia effusa]